MVTSASVRPDDDMYLSLQPYNQTDSTTSCAVVPTVARRLTFASVGPACRPMVVLVYRPLCAPKVFPKQSRNFANLPEVIPIGSCVVLIALLHWTCPTRHVTQNGQYARAEVIFDETLLILPCTRRTEFLNDGLSNIGVGKRDFHHSENTNRNPTHRIVGPWHGWRLGPPDGLVHRHGNQRQLGSPAHRPRKPCTIATLSKQP